MPELEKTVAIIRIRRGTFQQWQNANPILMEGELGLISRNSSKDAGKFKAGDGVTRWNDLPYNVADGIAGTIETITIETIEYNQPAEIINNGTPNKANLLLRIPQGRPGNKGDTGISIIIPDITELELTETVNLNTDLLYLYKEEDSILYKVKAGSLISSIGNFNSTALTINTTMANLQSTLDSLPKLLAQNVTIRVSPGTITTDIVIQRFYGPGSLIIYAVDGSDNLITTTNVQTHKANGFTIQYNNLGNDTILQGFTATATSGNCFNVYRNYSGRTAIAYCNAVSGSKSTLLLYGIKTANADVYIKNCTLSNKEIAILAEILSNVLVESCSGSNNTILFAAINGGILSLQNTMSITGDNNSYIDRGGVIIKPDGMSIVTEAKIQTKYESGFIHRGSLPAGDCNSAAYWRSLRYGVYNYAYTGSPSNAPTTYGTIVVFKDSVNASTETNVLWFPLSVGKIQKCSCNLATVTMVWETIPYQSDLPTFYNSGTSWYIKFANGFIIQGFVVTGSGTFSFAYPMANANYIAVIGQGNIGTSGTFNNSATINNKTTTTVQISIQASTNITNVLIFGLAA